MKSFYDAIIENELKFSELASKQFSDKEGLIRENIRAVLEGRGIAIRETIAQTNDLIAKYITPHLKNPEQMTEKVAMELQDFAERLSGYRESIDTGLSYDIRKALAVYALAIGNEQMYIKNMFFKGLALFYLDKTLFKEEMSECYDLVIAYSDRYEQLDKESRNLIVRAYGNSYISVADLNLKEIYRRYDKALDFWNTTAKNFDPDFPWESYFHNLHENLCSSTITALRSSDRKHTVTNKQIKRLYASAERLYNSYNSNNIIETNDYTSKEVKYLYFYNAARYYNNKISVHELVDFLFEVYKQADDDYSYDDLYKKLHVAALFLHYLGYVSPEEFSDEYKMELAQQVEKDVFDYVVHIPDEISRSYVTMLLTNFALGSHHIFDDYVYLKLLLSLTVFRHPPTYVHSVMVAKISFTVIEYVAKYHPKELIGIPGIKSVSDVEEQIDELLHFVWLSGLMHDIGKIVYSHMVSFYARKLTDKEFEMIQQHSDKAKDFIKKEPNVVLDTVSYETIQSATDLHFSNNTELFSCISDIALGHHKSYNGKFGYPQSFDNIASPVKIIIDTISVADSIDAATDNVGRSYANEKTLEDMREDLLSQIGTRYSPFITKLIFENDYLYDAISDILREYRYDMYYSCFTLSDFSNTILPPKRTLF